MEKKFKDIQDGDTIYLIEIDNSEVSTLVERLKVKEVLSSHSTHITFKLSDNRVIAPSPINAFHVVTLSKKAMLSELPLTCEVYATSEKECIRITGNMLEVKSKKIQEALANLNSEQNKIYDCMFALMEYTDNAAKKETTTEVVYC